ncbi:hypothetical protein EON63_22375, partial [archaeon]
MAFPWQSEDMWNALRLFAPYIQAGQLTLFSHADIRDKVFNKDESFNIGAGARVHYDFSKILAVNMCLYYARGLADYLAVWDVDEFFLPSNPKQPISQLLASLETISANKCYVEVSSSTYFNSHPAQLPMFRAKQPVPTNYTYMKLWTDHHYQRFVIRGDFLSHKKAILHVDRVMYSGLHNAGGCIKSGNMLNSSAIFQATSQRIPTHDILYMDRDIGQIYHFQYSRTIHYELAFAKTKPPNNTCTVMSWKHALPGADCANPNGYVQYYRDKVLTALYNKGYYSALMLVHAEQDSMLNYTLESHTHNLKSIPNPTNTCASKKVRNLPVSLSMLHNTTMLSSSLVRLPSNPIHTTHHTSGLEYDMAPSYALVIMTVSNMSLVDYKVYCQLIAGRLSYSLPASYYPINPPHLYHSHTIHTGYVQCDLTRQIMMDTLNSTLTIQLTLHSHITFETSGTVSPRSCVVVFQIPKGMIGTGLGYPR